MNEMFNGKCGVIENFMEDVKTRVNVALEDYKNEIHHEFELARVGNDQMKNEFLAHFNSVAHEVEEKAKQNLYEALVAHAMGNGQLWGGVVRAQAEKVEQQVKKHFLAQKEGIRDEIASILLHKCDEKILGEVKTHVEKQNMTIGMLFLQPNCMKCPRFTRTLQVKRKTMCNA